jgi:tetratricopeptide (TPR) repeat protein
MKKVLLIIFCFVASNYITKASEIDIKFDSLMNLGKQYYRLYDTSDVDFIFRLIDLKKSMEYTKSALNVKPDNPEANYYMGYIKDAEFYGNSPGDSIPLSSLSKVREISQYFENSIKSKEKLTYEKLILSPYSKISSLYGCAAFAYMIKGDIDSAIFCFKEAKEKNAFTDVALEFARNLLSNCDTNTILITWGDMDTFPIYFLQLVDNYRRDVTVVNAGLLSTQWYIKLNLFSDIFNKINSSFSESSIDSISAITPMEIEPQTYSLAVSSDDLERYNVKDNLVKSSLNFNWVVYGQKFGESNYLTISDIVLLDIFKTNKWKRKIALSVTGNANILYCYGWSQNVKQKGLIYELSPDTYVNDEQVDYNFLRNKLFSESGWSFKEVRNPIAIADSDSRIFLSNYQQTFLLLGYYYYQVKKDVTKTKEVLHLFENVLPWSIVPIDNRDLNYWTDLYRFIGEPDKANYIQGEFFDK